MRPIDGRLAGRTPRPADLWVHVIEASDTEHDVVLALREYLAMWGPEELARLPEECRPGKITDAVDIGDLAYRMSRAHLEFSGSRENRLLLERMMGFVTHAATRAACISARERLAAPDPQ